MATFLDLQLFLTYNPPATPCSPQTPLHPAAHPYRRLFSAPSNVYSGLLPVFSCNLLDLYSHPPPTPAPDFSHCLSPQFPQPGTLTFWAKLVIPTRTSRRQPAGSTPLARRSCRSSGRP